MGPDPTPELDYIKRLANQAPGANAPANEAKLLARAEQPSPRGSLTSSGSSMSTDMVMRFPAQPVENEERESSLGRCKSFLGRGRSHGGDKRRNEVSRGL